MKDSLSHALSLTAKVTEYRAFFMHSMKLFNNNSRFVQCMNIVRGERGVEYPYYNPQYYLRVWGDNIGCYIQSCTDKAHVLMF